MELILLAGVLGVIPAMIAQKKGYAAGLWWLYGAALFVIALPHALLLEPKREVQDRCAENSGRRKCPFCAEMIMAEARLCRFCNRELPAVAQINDAW